MTDPAVMEKPVRRKIRHFFLIVLFLALLMTLFGQILGDVLLSVVVMAVGGVSDDIMFLFMYLSFIGIDALVLLYCFLFEKDVFRSFLPAKAGGGRGNTGRHFALGLLLGCAMNGLCILLAWLHGDLSFSVGRFRVFYLAAGLLCVCVQSGAEELVARGYIMGAARERYPVWFAILLNTLFFTVLHLGNPGITVVALTEIAAIGLALSLIIYCFDSMWMAIAIHTAWNYTQSLLCGLPNSGIVSQGSFLHLESARTSFLYDAAFGVEGTIPSVLVSAVLIAGTVFFFRRQRVLNVEK